MAVRDFDGSDDVLRVTAPAFFAGAFTYVAVAYRDTNTGFHAFMSIGNDSTTNPYIVYELSDSADIEWVNREGPAVAIQNQDNSIWSATGAWKLYAITYDNVNPHRHHIFDGTTWTHVATNSVTGGVYTTDPSDWSGGGNPVLRFGNWNASFNFFDGKMAVQALNIGTGLTDGELEALAGGDRDSYVTAGFDHLWELGETPVSDYIGSLDQLSIVGTSIVTGNDPPSTIYSLPAPVVARVWRARPV